MKRFTAILTAFLTFIFISINSLPVFALPPEFPVFRYDAYSALTSGGDRIFAHVILYSSSTDSYKSYSFATASNYLSYDYLSLVPDSTNSCYLLANQDHLSSDTVICYINGVNGSLNGEAITTFTYKMNFRFTNSTIFSNQDSNALNNSISTSLSSGIWEIALSTCNIKIGDEIVYYGSQSAFYNACVPYNDKYLPYPELTTPVEPPTETPTEAPTIGDTDYDKESVETSKSILENVKTIITNIANLPSNIANAIKNFFSDLLSGIITGLNNLKDGIIQGLKDLFIPSDNAFTDIKEIVNDKFGFISQIKDLFSAFVNYTFADSETPPEFTITYKGNEISIIDWSLYAPYRMTVHFIIIAISYLSFIMRLYKRLPGYIGGFY